MPRYRIAAWLLIFSVALTLFLICWGSIVKSSGSSLGCPDWPTCYGLLVPDTTYLSPEASRQLFWEYGHRVIATTLGILAIVSVFLLWQPHPAFPPMRNAALGLVGLVIFQGLLGATTVLLDIDHLVSAVHLGVSMIVLMYVIYLAREAWLRQASQPSPDPWPAPSASAALTWAGWALLAIYAQILLGAVVRHSGATWAAGRGPDASMLGIDPNTGQTVLFSSNIFIMLNLAHRYFAVLVSLFVAAASIPVWKRLGAGADGPHRFLIWLPLILILCQVMVGIGMVAMRFALFMRTMHLGLGGALLAAQFLLYIEISRSARR